MENRVTGSSQHPDHDGKRSDPGLKNQAGRSRRSHSGPNAHRSDRPPVPLLSLGEVREAWGVSYFKVYRHLTAYRRQGHQPYYSLAEVEQKWGEPRRPLSIERGTSPMPPYPSSADLRTPHGAVATLGDTRRLTKTLAERLGKLESTGRANCVIRCRSVTLVQECENILSAMAA